MKLNKLSLATFFALALNLTISHGAAISLDFNSLPSAQGWTFVNLGHPGVDEEDVFMVDGTMLMQRTFGVGFGGEGNGQSLRYEHPIMPFPSGIYALEWTSETIRTERDTDNTAGFFFGFRIGSDQYSVGFRADLAGNDHHMRAPNGTNVSVDHDFDSTVAHTYRIEADSVARTYTVSIDGNPVPALTGLTPLVTAGTTNIILFGDATNSANADGNIKSLSFVPEPSRALLLVIGTCVMLTNRRRRLARAK